MNMMNRTDLISVIVPVYKVEQYLDQCVQSIVDQTYKNLEIILVDDGSPDNCPAMCDAWAEKDNRIKVIHKKNGGLSDARNAGMEIATGDFIAFIDSDDYIRLDMLELLYSSIITNNSDISACGIEMVYDNGAASQKMTSNQNIILDNIDAVNAIIDETILKQPVWYKLYKSALVKDILFPVGKYHEDVFWSYQAIAKASKVSIFTDVCYFYRQRSESIMSEGYSLKRLDAIEGKIERIEFLKSNYPTITNKAIENLLFSCIYHGQLSIKFLLDVEQKNALTKLKGYFKKYYMPLKELSITHKCWLIMASFSFNLTCRLRNLLKIGL